MTAFEYATAGRIVFGRGSYSKLPDLVAELGARAMYITGSRRRDSGRFVVAGEPTVEMVREAVAQCREGRYDCVVGVGGGSVMDAAKATAVLAANEGDVLDYLEVIGAGKSVSKPGLPCIAVPTTAGTGTEVTRNAVIGSPEHGVKASLRSSYLLPKVAVVDPELTLDLPREITANTGLDALTQLIEAFLSVRANAFTDALCRDGIPRAAEALPRAWSNGDEIEARTEMSFAALLGGMALANAGLGVVHGFAAPIGGMFHKAPHGAVCAALLPHGIKANYAAASQRAPELLPRFETVARLLTANPNATPEHAVSFLQDLCDELHVNGLSAYGVTAEHVPELVSKAEKASSMKANPLKLTRDELEQVLQAAL